MIASYIISYVKFDKKDISRLKMLGSNRLLQQSPIDEISSEKDHYFDTLKSPIRGGRHLAPRDAIQRGQEGRQKQRGRTGLCQTDNC